MSGEDPSFSNLFAVEQTQLETLLKTLWERTMRAERDAAVAREEAAGAAAAAAEALASASGSSSAVRVLERAVLAGEGRTDELADAVAAMAGEVGALAAQVDGVGDAVQDAVAEAMARALGSGPGPDGDGDGRSSADLVASVEAVDEVKRSLASVAAVVSSLEDTLAGLASRLDSLSLDDLIEEKARADHLAIVEDDGIVHHYDTQDAASLDADASLGTKENVASADAGADAPGRPGVNPGNRVLARPKRPVGLETKAGLDVVRAGAGDGGSSAASKAAVALLEARLAAAAAEHSSALDGALARMEERASKQLHSYASLNETVNVNRAAVEDLLVSVPRLAELAKGSASKDDLAKAFDELDGKITAMAEVSNANTQVLASVLDSKANSADVDVLLDAYYAANDESAALAGGRIHFRCISCNALHPSFAGCRSSSTAASLSPTSPHPPTLSPHPPRASPPPLLGLDKKPYHAGFPAPRPSPPRSLLLTETTVSPPSAQSPSSSSSFRPTSAPAPTTSLSRRRKNNFRR